MEWTKEDQEDLLRLLSASNTATAGWMEKKAEGIRQMMVYCKCAMMETVFSNQ